MLFKPDAVLDALRNAGVEVLDDGLTVSLRAGVEFTNGKRPGVRLVE